MCVLATTGPDGPLATPVRYYIGRLRGDVHRLAALAEDAEHRRRPTCINRHLRAAGRNGKQPRRPTVRQSQGPWPWPSRPRPLLGGVQVGERARRNAAGRCPNRPATRSWSPRPIGSSTPSTGCGAKDSRHVNSGVVENASARLTHESSRRHRAGDVKIRELVTSLQTVTNTGVYVG